MLLKAVINAHSDHLRKSLFDGAITYLINARESSELEPLFIKIIENVSEYKETIMTYAEELRREGEERGIQRGIQRGMQKAKQEIAKNLLKSGFDAKAVAMATDLSSEEVEKLK